MQRDGSDSAYIDLARRFPPERERRLGTIGPDGKGQDRKRERDRDEGEEGASG